MKTRLARVMVVLVAADLVSCAPSPHDNDREGVYQTATQFLHAQATSSEPSIATSNALAKGSTNVRRFLTFTYESGHDPGYQQMARSLLRSNSNAWNAVRGPYGELDTGVLAASDYNDISSLLSKFEHFTPDEQGTLVRYAGFAIAIIGGCSEGSYWNAYLLRTPKAGWMFLEFREVPEPRH